MRVSLEAEGHAGTDGAGGLDQVYGLAILAEDGDVSLSEEVAEIDDGFDVATVGGQGLAHEEIQVRIAGAGRGVEHVDWGQGSRSFDPAIRGDPAGMGARQGAGQFRGDRVAALRVHIRLDGLKRDILLR